jgi:hypothetical protein
LTDWRTVALLFIGLLAAGCAVSVVDLRDTLDLNQATFRDKLDTRAGLADEFLACTTRAYDERVAFPADRSFPDDDAGRDGPLQAIHTLITRVKEGRPSHAESLHILEDTLADWTRTSYRRLDLGKLRKVVDVIKHWHIHFDFDEDALAEDGSRFAQLLLAYNMAYFGDIRYTAGPRAGSGLQAVARNDFRWLYRPERQRLEVPGTLRRRHQAAWATRDDRSGPSGLSTDHRRPDPHFP